MTLNGVFEKDETGKNFIDVSIDHRSIGVSDTEQSCAFFRKKRACQFIQRQKRSDMTIAAKNTICIWYNGDAEDAARFYAATFPDSSVGAVHYAP